jgi:hypothetical protein
MSKSIIAGIIASFQIVVLFIIFLLIYEALSPLATTPQTQAVLESGQEATIEAFDWWLLIDAIGGILLFLSIIFGIIWAVIKIVEQNNPISL